MKRITFLFTLTLFFSQQVFGQIAPNFIITDTHNQQHNLYEDYLDQGKTVLIDFFFVNCPPCQSFAPTLQSLYEEWGAGDENVQFFSLSVRETDSNASVASFDNNFGITFPSAGNDGGGYDATRPYVNGDFGQFWGTPSVAVIAPDGTVNYNVGTNPANINAAILAASNTTTDPEPSVLEINFVDKYGNPIDNVDLHLTSDAIGAPLIPIQLDENNQIMFEDFESQYGNLNNPMIVPEKLDNPSSGISTQDITLTLWHILGIKPFDSIYNELAADVNSDNLVTAFDLVQTRQMILGIIDEFPSSPSYKFVPSLQEIDPQPGETIQLEFVAYKVGNTSY